MELRCFLQSAEADLVCIGAVSTAVCIYFVCIGAVSTAVCVYEPKLIPNYYVFEFFPTLLNALFVFISGFICVEFDCFVAGFAGFLFEFYEL
jgi:hypothetical protein